MKNFLTIATAIAALLACRIGGADDDTPEPQDTPTITQSWSQETGYARPYWVHVPDPPAPKIKPTFPVAIFLHGNGGNAQGLRDMVFRRYPTIAREFITVFPQGYLKSWNIVSERSRADDRGFVEAIVRKLAERDDVDKDNFTVMGISNGAALANQIAIESQLPHIKNIVTSVSPLNAFQHDGKHFKAKGDDNSYDEIAEPRTGIRILNISGTDDRLVPYTGGPSKAIPAKGGKLPFVDAEVSAFLWATHLGHEGKQLAAPTRTDGQLETFSYLDGDVVHLKANDRGHNATAALTESLLLEFLRP